MRIAGKYLVTAGFIVLMSGLYLEIFHEEFIILVPLFLIGGFVPAFYGFRRMDEEEKKHGSHGIHA